MTSTQAWANRTRSARHQGRGLSYEYGAPSGGPRDKAIAGRTEGPAIKRERDALYGVAPEHRNRATASPVAVIVEYGGQAVRLSGTLPRVVAETPIGHEIGITVLRDGKRVPLTAKIGELADPARPTRARALGRASRD